MNEGARVGCDGRVIVASEDHVAEILEEAREQARKEARRESEREQHQRRIATEGPTWWEVIKFLVTGQPPDRKTRYPGLK